MKLTREQKQLIAEYMGWQVPEGDRRIIDDFEWDWGARMLVIEIHGLPFEVIPGGFPWVRLGGFTCYDGANLAEVFDNALLAYVRALKERNEPPFNKAK